ncbi:MAG: hypothetical protein KU37_09930 [Sulfuricurvum sp. PC08-66]|nr:MAG: hypothetical protein KU37_09930 [Sulfuricurvum sp. PC08-66]
MVSPLGVDALAAVGLGLQFTMLLGVVMVIYSVGGSILIARYRGSGRLYRANAVLYMSLLLALGLSLVMTLLLYPFAGVLYEWMYATPNVAAQGVAYWGVILLFLPLLFIDTLFFSYFSSMGNTLTPLIIKILATFANVVLNYALIFGHWGAPQMGVAGAAWATVIALAITLLLYALFFWRQKGYFFVPLWRANLFRALLQLGVPAMVERAIGSLSFMFFVAIIASYSTYALAAYQLGLRIEGMAYMIGIGFSVASTTLVGHALGAKTVDVAYRLAIHTAKLAALLMGLEGMILLFFPEWLLGFFTTEAVVIEEGALYLRMVGISQIPLAMMFVLSASLRTFGAVKLALYISLGSLWIFRIIPAYIVSYVGGEIVWVYVAMTVETFIKGYLFYYFFRRRFKGA